MKNSIAAFLGAALFFVCSTVSAQCCNQAFVQQPFVATSGFGNVQCVNGVCFAQQQVIAAPQSIGFFAASQPSFVTRQFISSPVAVVTPSRQDIIVRRGLFGRVRRITTINRDAVVVPGRSIRRSRSRVFVR